MKSILIVDDNPANIGILFECLENEGFRIVVAQDGADAVEIARNTTPNLILLDIIMPEMDGFSTCIELKKYENTKDIPIIFMTALTDTDNKLKGFNLGAVDYICKPFQQEEVIARIKTHLTIQEQKNNLLRLNREKEKMISIIAHDLRSPFNGILGLLNLLTDSYHTIDDNERLQYIQYINDSAESVYSLVEELLTWIISGKGELDFNPKELELFKIAESSVSVARNNATSKNIHIKIDIDKDIKIFADANMISAVIRNIVSNSVKFTASGGEISVCASKNTHKIKLIISDTGVGMRNEVIDNILSGSGYLSTPGTANEPGTGLGLIISKEFIDKNNGSLDISSSPGKGTDFIINIPIPD